MKSSTKRLLALVLAVMFVAAACSSDSTDENSDGNTDTTADGSGGDTTDPDETVELTQDGGLLAAVQARGVLRCGVSGEATGFSITEPDGSTTGFDSDYCRAVAAAVFGDATAVEFVALTAGERFTAVQTGDVDLLMRNTTWTQSRDTDLGMDFGPTTYYDGQQLMGRASFGFTPDSTVADIAGAIVCTNAGTTTEKNVVEAADAAGVTITLNPFDSADTAFENYVAGACDIFTTDGGVLVGRKFKQQPADEEWVIFPSQPISKEPLGPTYGQNDSQWADVINWTVFATIIADEYGINSANVADFLAEEGEISRLLGTSDDELQSAMGLSKDAFYQVISQVGNYTEIYDANLTPLGLQRAGSPNAPCNQGGLIYAPPAR